MQSLRDVKDFGIKKGMNLKELMSAVENNLHGESTIQIQEFKKESKNVINHQLYDFFPLVNQQQVKKKIINGFGLHRFMDVIRQNRKFNEKLNNNTFIDEKGNPKCFIPDVKVDVYTKDYCRFYSLVKAKSEIYDEINSGQFNKEDKTFPRIEDIKYRRMDDTEFITTNMGREIERTTHFNSPNIFAGNRTLEELEALFEHFGSENYHKVVACNEEQGYALVHKITLNVSFPQANYFQFSEDSDLKLEVFVEIFHQYFLSGRNDEGGYFITAIVFPDPKMLMDLIRTQDFNPFLTWFNREDQGYKRIQGDMLYKIVPLDRLKTWDNMKDTNIQFHDIPLDTLYNDYCELSNTMTFYYGMRRLLMEQYVLDYNNKNSNKTLSLTELEAVEKKLMKDHIGEKNFNFSHHNIRSFGSKKNKLTNNIQMVTKDRINQYILITGASRCILQHEQHEARALSIPNDSMLIISHQRGKDITNLFAD